MKSTALSKKDWLAQGMTLKQLVNGSDSLRKRGSNAVVVKQLEWTKAKNGMLIAKALVTSEVSSTKLYKVWITFTHETLKSKIKTSSLVHVQCSCSDYMYTWEYANAAHNAARLFYCNGEYPIEKNPGLAPGLCIAKGELINTDRGLIPIENVAINDHVNTLDGLRLVTDSFFTGIKNVYNIRLVNGAILKTTINHKILVFRLGSIKWIRAKHLNDSDYVIQYSRCCSVPNYVNLRQKDVAFNANGNSVLPSRLPRIVDENLASLLGYMVSEGSKNKFANTNVVVLKDFAKKHFKCFGYEPKICSGGIYITSYITKLFSNIGLVYGSSSQIIPRAIFESPDSVISAFLQSLYEGDGWITDRNSTYGSKSKLLAEEVQILLLAQGIRTSITINMSGVNHIKMYLVRTSSFQETQKLIRFIQPLTKGLELQDYSPSELTSHTPKCDMIPNCLGYIVRLEVAFRLDRLRETYLDLKCELKQSLDMLGLKLLEQTKSYYTILIESGYSVEYVTKYTNSIVKLSDVFDCFYSEIFNRLERRVKHEVGYFNVNGRDFNTLDRYKLKNLNFEKFSNPKIVRTLNVLTQDDVLVTKVQSVEFHGESEVYDLTVDGAQHFVANGMVVHNCKHGIKLSNVLIRGY